MKPTTFLAGLVAAAATGLTLPAALAQTAAQPTAAADAPMPLTYEVAARETPAVVRQSTCPILVVPTDDQRLNKLTIGASMRGPLLTGDASPWVTDGLLQLKDFGFAAQKAPAGAAPTEGLMVKTTLSRAYTWQVGLKLFSMVALKAQFVDKNGVLQEKHYRAHGDKTNMWGASSEYVTALNYGLNNLLRAMADDLTLLCKGTKVEAYTYAGPEAKPAAK
jgi:hypothetical protein